MNNTQSQKIPNVKSQSHTHNRFTALWILSGTTRVSWYQKKHLPTHTYPGDQSSLICFIHLIMAFSLLKCHSQSWNPKDRCSYIEQSLQFTWTQDVTWKTKQYWWNRVHCGRYDCHHHTRLTGSLLVVNMFWNDTTLPLCCWQLLKLMWSPLHCRLCQSPFSWSPLSAWWLGEASFLLFQ